MPAAQGPGGRLRGGDRGGTQKLIAAARFPARTAMRRPENKRDSSPPFETPKAGSHNLKFRNFPPPRFA